MLRCGRGSVSLPAHQSPHDDHSPSLREYKRQAAVDHVTCLSCNTEYVRWASSPLPRVQDSRECSKGSARLEGTTTVIDVLVCYSQRINDFPGHAPKIFRGNLFQSFPLGRNYSRNGMQHADNVGSILNASKMVSGLFREYCSTVGIERVTLHHHSSEHFLGMREILLRLLPTT